MEKGPSGAELLRGREADVRYHTPDLADARELKFSAQSTERSWTLAGHSRKY